MVKFDAENGFSRSSVWTALAIKRERNKRGKKKAKKMKCQYSSIKRWVKIVP